VDNARLFAQLRLEHRRKDEFLATLAHELRNPLAPIRTGFALLGPATDPETTARIRQVVERQLTHMVRLIDDLLDLSRVTRGTVQLERTRVDLAAIVGIALEASRPLLDQTGLLLDVRLPQEPVPLDADSTRLAQVLSNLLNNAAKYTSRGGRGRAHGPRAGS
jgi:signal transduction histidine kinase